MYVKLMKKVQDKGDEYVKTEQERLGRILGESIELGSCLDDGPFFLDCKVHCKQT